MSFSEKGALFGSARNHCGVALGITLGRHKTNSDGEVSVTAPSCAIAVTVHYFIQKEAGPAGIAFGLRDSLLIGGRQMTTVKRLWTLPEHDYFLRLRTSTSQPVAGAHLEGCLFEPPCMSACGPVGLGLKSDASGVIRFREKDLREMGTLRVVNAQGKERNLTEREMRELMTTYQLSLLWE